MYRIYDWAGNLCVDLDFNTFDDAWDYILGDLADRLNLQEDDLQEYVVKHVE